MNDERMATICQNLVDARNKPRLPKIINPIDKYGCCDLSIGWFYGTEFDISYDDDDYEGDLDE